MSSKIITMFLKNKAFLDNLEVNNYEKCHKLPYFYDFDNLTLPKQPYELGVSDHLSLATTIPGIIAGRIEQVQLYIHICYVRRD